ncbi:MAG: hypothetical protein HFH15_05305 [Ruminococcus sp.]|jgi:hypothetical protein|nr:hypothetical protein [Ruminococcus sp.]
MNSSPKDFDNFSDDFEVTYEEELSFQYNLDPEDEDRIQDQDRPDTTTQPMRQVRQNGRRFDLSIENPDNGYDGYYDQDYDEDYAPPKNHSNHNRRRQYRDPAPSPRASQMRRGQTPLAAPIQKGGKTVSRISHSLFRNLSLILLLVIIGFMAYNFFRGSAPYGDIQNEIASQNYTEVMASYLVVAAFFILYELLSALWAMTRAGYYREDTGRGMFSFFFIYICSHGAFFISNWIPETTDFLRGAKGALEVFGSMHNVLFGLCAAGVISCLIRKYSTSL